MHPCIYPELNAVRQTFKSIFPNSETGIYFGENFTSPKRKEKNTVALSDRFYHTHFPQ